jgi:hypothetical protein
MLFQFPERHFLGTTVLEVRTPSEYSAYCLFFKSRATDVLIVVLSFTRSTDRVLVAKRWFATLLQELTIGWPTGEKNYHARQQLAHRMELVMDAVGLQVRQGQCRGQCGFMYLD